MVFISDQLTTLFPELSSSEQRENLGTDHSRSVKIITFSSDGVT